MKKIIERLSSMHLTLWTLVFLILCVGTALIMTGSESFTKELKIMDNTHIREWLLYTDTGALTLKAWFVILCLAMLVIGINLVFCSWSKIFKILNAKFSGNQLFMLIVHGIFGFVALFHFGGLMLGFEHNNIKLGEGKVHVITEGYRIKINKIHFVGDIKALNKGKRNITRDELNYKESYAEVSLSKGDELLKIDKIYLLRPMHYGNVQVTLSSFITPDAVNGDPGTGATPWCIFTLTCNPVLKPFLIIYPVMIAGILIYLMMTWRKPRLIAMNGK